MKDNNKINSKIDVGTLVKEKVGEMNEKKRGVIIRRMMKEVVGCFQDVTVKKKFLAQF